MSFADYTSKLGKLVGNPPVYDPTKEIQPQVIEWIKWSERRRMLHNFTQAQRDADDEAKAAKAEAAPIDI